MFSEKSLFLFLFLFFLPSLPPAPSLESPQREARFRIFARAFRQASGFTSPVTTTFFVIWFTLMLLTPANYRANPNFQTVLQVPPNCWRNRSMEIFQNALQISPTSCSADGDTTGTEKQRPQPSTKTSRKSNQSPVKLSGNFGELSVTYSNLRLCRWRH